MIAFYDNALPIAYSTMRQHARRAKHPTLHQHHMDIMCQVRAEVSARAPPPTAFVATGSGAGAHLRSGGGGKGAGGGGGGNPDRVCLRCGKEGRLRNKCRARKKPCHHCGADHLSDFCGRPDSSLCCAVPPSYQCRGASIASPCPRVNRSWSHCAIPQSSCCTS